MRSRIHGFLAALAVISLLITPSSMAARRVVTTATTGLVSLTPGHVAILTLADVGNVADRVVPVQLEILDGGNRILASTRGELRPGQPLDLEVRDDVVTGSRLPVRPRVVVFQGGGRPAKLRGPKIALTFEIMDSSTGDIALVTQGPICFPGGAGIEFHCPGDLSISVEPIPE